MRKKRYILTVLILLLSGADAVVNGQTRQVYPEPSFRWRPAAGDTLLNFNPAVRAGEGLLSFDSLPYARDYTVIVVYKPVADTEAVLWPPYEVSYQNGITIHSHPNDNTAEWPGEEDPAAFRNYHQNIIVGPITSKISGSNTIMVSGESERIPGLAFYPNLVNTGQFPDATLSIHAAENIVNQKSHVFFEHTVGKIIKSS